MSICESGGRGLVFPMFGEMEHSWPRGLRATLYFLGLCWFFLGVAQAADMFMESIERITAKEKEVMQYVGGGMKRRFHVKVWNATVANLTLMALGSSAPEILLSVIELFGNNMYAGELGPSTIVGSAAFNLMVIIAVCISSLPPGETRKIKDLGVFAVTATASLFAYMWMLVILVWNTPDLIDIWEGALTFVFFPILVAISYAADAGVFSFKGKKKPVGTAVIQAALLDRDMLSEEERQRIREEIIAVHGDLPDDQLNQLVEYEIQQAALKAGEKATGAAGRRGSAGGPGVHARRVSASYGRVRKKGSVNSNDDKGSVLSGGFGMPLSVGRPSMFATKKKVQMKGMGSDGALAAVGSLAEARKEKEEAEEIKKNATKHSKTEPSLLPMVSLEAEAEAQVEPEGDKEKAAQGVPPAVLEGGASSPSRKQKSGMGLDVSQASSPSGKARLQPAAEEEIFGEPEDSKEQAGEAPKLPVGGTQAEKEKQTTELSPQSSLPGAASPSFIVAADKENEQAGGSEEGGNALARQVTDVSLGFVDEWSFVMEEDGFLHAAIRREGFPNCVVEADFATIDGTAKVAQNNYKFCQGTFRLDPLVIEKVLRIEAIDEGTRVTRRLRRERGEGPADNSEREDEVFFLQLARLRVLPADGTTQQKSGGKEGTPPAVATLPDGRVLKAIPGKKVRSKCFVFDNSMPSIIDFKKDEYSCRESDKYVTLTVVRTGGLPGGVKVKYRTEEDTAKAGADYEPVEGELTFEAGEMEKQITVKIYEDDEVEDREKFKVILEDPEPEVAAKFNQTTDGGDERCVAVVWIEATEGYEGMVSVNRDHWNQVWSEWREQYESALYVNGSKEEQAEAGIVDWCLHIAGVPWKLLLAACPPSSLWNGLGRFLVALFFIGLLTAMIGDLASLLGCVLSIPDSLTAITIVALGTSLPDTFASRIATVQDDTADNAVGNVTGSNSVNVFLGLGLPWFIGACYWYAAGPVPEWKERYPEIASMYPEGGFAVPAGDLAFSVIIFMGCAVSTLGVLIARRAFLGAELGGHKGTALLSSAVLCSLWAIYIVLSAMKMFGVISFSIS